jgi:hypothetical protein
MHTVKDELLSRIEMTKADWNSLLSALSVEQFERLTVGHWKVKDILAHLTWHEREIIQLLRSRVLKGSELWNLPLEQRNEVIYEENKDRPLEDLLREAEQVYRELWELLQNISDEELQNPATIANLPTEWQPLEIIAQNTWQHYEEHTRDVRNALKQYHSS